MRPNFGIFGSLTFAAALLLSASAVYGQGYSTNFNSFTKGSTLSDQNGWVTNDEDNGAMTSVSTGSEGIGQSDYVGFVAGVNTATTDYSGELGGLFQGSQVPGASSVFLYHPFTLGVTASYTFNVDQDIQRSQTPKASNDTFHWTFRNGNTTVFSIDYVPQTTTASSTAATVYAVRYTVPGLGGTQTSTGMGFFSDKQYHLSVSVTAATFSFALTANGVSVGANNVPLLTNIGTSVNEVAATWDIADKTTDNGGYVNAGTNTFVFDNYAVVPEPSTWAALSIGAAMLMLTVRRRLRA